MKAVTLILLTAASVWAQSSWLSSNPKDSPNAAHPETLTLRGAYLSSGGVARPNVTLVCRDGKLLSSSFNTSLTRGVARAAVSPGYGKLAVSIRVVGKRQAYREWKRASGYSSFQVDPRFVRDLVTAGRVDIDFSTSSASKMTADFQSSPADAPRVIKACGIH
jgi:hypothetical protein